MVDNSQTRRDIDRILNAASIAVVGASPDPAKLGSITLATIIRGGYKGKIYPINPKASEIQGLKAYPSLSAVPDPIDVAFVLVPAQAVAGVLREAAAKGCAGSVILTAGFREAGHPEREAEIAQIAQETGMRLIGPNIQGIAYVPNKLSAMFWPTLTTEGPIGIVSQSGSVTGALGDWSTWDEVGCSAAINLGNQTDLCDSDFVDFLGEDPKTRSIAVYCEGPKQGRRFIETAARVAKKKGVAVLKSGRTASGRRATASHTGSLAGDDEVFSAACRQNGVYRAEDIEALYDAAKAMALIKPPKGNRLFAVSTSGGTNALAMDVAEKCGLVIPKFPPDFLARLDTINLPALSGRSNPLDLGGITEAEFMKVVTVLEEYDLADTYLLVFADPVPGAVNVAQYMVDKGFSTAVCYYGGGDQEKLDRVELGKRGIACFPSPERTIRAIGAAAWASMFRATHA
jgi:acyl-CoA synthetase (NDP forming)